MWLISVFLAALIAWSAILWLVLPLDIFKYSLASIVAMHVVVPAAIVSIWMLTRRWYQFAQQAKASAAEISRNDIRNAEKARQKHLFDEALKNRRGGIDCRWVAIADVIFQGDAAPLEDTDRTSTRFYAAQPQASTQTLATIQPWPSNSLVELFDELFSAVPAAITLPIAVCGPASRTISENEKLIRQAHKIALDRQHIDESLRVTPAIVPLSPGDSDMFTTLHNVFSRHRDWPGLIAIAFDNRIADRSDDLEGFQKNGDALTDNEKWLGSASRAISLSVMTQTELSDVLLKLTEAGEGSPIDALTPYWEREKIPVGMASLLMKWPKSWRENFSTILPIATIHRADFAELAERKSLSQHINAAQESFVEAAINASLLSLDFTFEGETDVRNEPPLNLIGDTGWLIHNAGNVSCCGERMATISSAMWQCGIELNPIDQATNAVMTVGDCGLASRHVQFALGVQRVATVKKSALCVEFSGPELSTYFVVPYRAAS